MTIQLLPAILPTSYADLSEKVSLIAPPATHIQIDIVDGVFATPSTWPIGAKADSEWQEILAQDTGLPKWDRVEYEIDLMVANPKEHIDAWIDAGSSTLIFHFTSCSASELSECISRARERGTRVGLAITPSSQGYETLLNEIDLLQVMGSDTIGRQGTSLDERVYDIISRIHAMSEVMIGVDIGVSKRTIKKLITAGATHFAAGSAIFADASPKDAYHTLLTIAEDAIHEA